MQATMEYKALNFKQPSHSELEDTQVLCYYTQSEKQSQERNSASQRFSHKETRTETLRASGWTWLYTFSSTNYIPTNLEFLCKILINVPTRMTHEKTYEQGIFLFRFITQSQIQVLFHVQEFRKPILNHLTWKCYLSIRHVSTISPYKREFLCKKARLKHYSNNMEV